LAKTFQIVETHWHDHSLENSWEALSDGTISFSIQPSEKCIFWNFRKKTCPELSIQFSPFSIIFLHPIPDFH
jgi:hypothetical protein